MQGTCEVLRIEHRDTAEHDDVQVPEKLFVGLCGTPIQFEAFEEACADGCCMCSDPIDIQEQYDTQTVTFYNDDAVVCEACFLEPANQALLYTIT